MDILVRGRNVEVPDHYRLHVAEKLQRVERFDHKIISVDVELFHERNRRQSNACQRVEITCKSRGPVVRSEACASDFYSALDACVARLEGRLRRAADRRRVHHGMRTPTSVAAATGATPAADGERDGLDGHAPDGSDLLDPEGFAPADLDGAAVATRNGTAAATSTSASAAVPTSALTAVLPADDRERFGSPVTDVQELDDPGPGRIVRTKEHPAKPMTIDQALFEMELVGHDFYLFSDADCGQPSVVYRRKGYDYGVIRLTS